MKRNENETIVKKENTSILSSLISYILFAISYPPLLSIATYSFYHMKKKLPKSSIYDEYEF